MRREGMVLACGTPDAHTAAGHVHRRWLITLALLLARTACRAHDLLARSAQWRAA